MCLVLCACRVHFDAPELDAAGDTCGATVPTSGTISGTLAASTAGDAGSCGGGDVAEAVYSIDVSNGAELLVTADEQGTTADTLIYIRSECMNASTEVVCDTESGMGDNGSYRLTSPTPGRYQIFIDGETAGDFVGRIETLLPAGADCDPANARDRCGAELTCTNQKCSSAACPLADMLTGAATYTRTAITSTAVREHAGSCGDGFDGGVRAPELIYQLILAAPASNVRVSTESPMTDYDSLIYMRQFTCTGTEVGCDDDTISGAGASQFDTGALPAGDYYIFVDGFGTRSGTAILSVTITP